MEAQLVKILMVRESVIQYERAVSRSTDCYEILKAVFSGADREMFVVVCLDSKNHINAINVASVGTLNHSLVHPREVFKPAILSNSVAIILAHNHPSGDPTPSHEDREITSRVIEAGRILEIAVLDSLVIGEGRFHSMADKCELGLGLFDKPVAPVDLKNHRLTGEEEALLLKALWEAGPEDTRKFRQILVAAIRAKKKKAKGKRAREKTHEDAPGSPIGRKGKNG